MLQATVLVADAETIVRHELRFGPLLRLQPQLEELIENAEGELQIYSPFFLGSYRGQAELGGQGPGTRGNRRLGERDYDHQQSILSQIRDKDRYPHITGLANLYASIRVYSEWTSGRGNALREAARASDSDPHLSEGQSNLPSVLSVIAQSSHTRRNPQAVSATQGHLSGLHHTYNVWTGWIIPR